VSVARASKGLDSPLKPLLTRGLWPPWMRVQTALGLLLCALASATWAQTAPAATSTAFDTARIGQIRQRMQEFVDAGKTAGSVVLLARRNHITAFATGYQDLETKTPMRVNSLFQIASMTKPVTALGIMLLFDEGRLALTDPVAKYLPNFANIQLAEKQADGTMRLRKPARAISIKDLLTHTSGIGGGYPDKYKDNFETRAYTLAEVVDAIPTRALEFEPGARWGYSNMGIAVLGRIIEVVSGKSYEQFLTERLFNPLKMEDTHFFLPESKRGRLATIYKVEDGKLVKAAVDHFRAGAKYPSPEAGLYTSAADLGKLYLMLLNGGVGNNQRLLSPTALELMTQNHTGDLRAGFSPGVGFGLGWAVVRNLEGTFRGQSIGTFGHGGLWKTYGYVDPKKQLVGVILMQRLSSDGDLADEFNAFMQLAAAAVLP
jgi:CubicO group peptidase (beta-lactamase class C family)